MKKYSLLVCVAVGLLTCSGNQPTVTKTTTVVPTVLWKTSSRDALPAGVDSVRITISSLSLSSSMVKTFSYKDNKGTIPSVPVNISITIKIEGIDSLGRVLYSGSVVVPKVEAPTMDITIEANQVTAIAPSDLVAQTLSYNSIRLIWKENSTNETYYLISRLKNGSTAWDSIGIATQNTFTDSTLAPVTQYQYRIIAVNAAGRSAATTPATATTLIMDKIGPLITITSFKKTDTVNTRSVTLYGTAHDTSGIYQVMINDIVAQLNGDQWIKQNYYLGDSVNTVFIKATDNSPFKNVALDTLTLIYKTTYVDTTNHAPMFTVTGDSMKATIKVGQTYKKVLRGLDVDANDTLRFTVSSPLSLLGKDTVEWLPKTPDIGSKNCYALVYDKKQAHDSIGWKITVLDSATPIPNHPPAFATKVSEIQDSASQNKFYTDTFIANDQDVGQKLTYSIVTGPTGLAIGGTSGIITWTPADTGTFTATARVTDDSGAHADIGWTITVVPATVKVNHPPQFVTKTMNMTGTATVGTLYKDTVTATDPDSGAVLRFSVVNGPVKIDSVTGIVTWTPTTKGNFSMTVRVKDEAGGQADLSWPVTVQAAQETVSDIDGNVYHTVTIGTQVWMVENLKTSKYNDGTAIPLVTANSAWSALTTPGYCWYNNDSTANRNTYGALYNWYAVNTRKLAPTGWHVPTDSEWTILTTSLGDTGIAGGKLKEAGTTHWDSPNTGATNTSGFSALPGGWRGGTSGSGAFYGVGIEGYWWSSTAYDVLNSWNRSMYNNNASVGRFNNRDFDGFSVRCVKGEPIPIWITYTTANGLADDYVTVIVIDRQGIKWFGTAGPNGKRNGVSKFNGTTWTTYDTSNGLANNVVWGAAIDREDNKRFGTEGGASKFDGTTWTTYTSANGLAHDVIFSVAVDSQDNKWFGTEHGGVSKFDGTTWTTYTHTNSGLVNDSVTIAIDGQNNKWFGTPNGVSKFDGTTWTTYTTANSGLVNNYINAITIDNQGNKWFATKAGVSKFDGTTWTTYTTANSGLAWDYISAIAIDGQGNKWFGTPNGVSEFGATWATYTSINSGLAIGTVFAISIDGQGNKWFGIFGGGVSMLN